MSVLGDITARLPFTKKPEKLEYFFALNIGPEKLVAGLWTIESGKLKIINSAAEDYTNQDEITNITDKLLDSVLGDSPFEPAKILFGVEDSWLLDDDLKDPYLKLLRGLVKELELTPMAYVATSHALVHFLEKQEGSPVTAVMVGIGKKFVTVSSVRAGKLDSGAVIERTSNLGGDIEKGVLTSMKVEVLPSKILVYGDGNLEKQKSELLSYPWMSKLSFLHFPKIEILEPNLEIKSVCLAGAVEINSDVKFDKQIDLNQTMSHKLSTPLGHSKEDVEDKTDVKIETPAEELGFVAGDITKQADEKQKAQEEASDILDSDEEVIDDEAVQDGDSVDLLDVEKEDGILRKDVAPSESVVMRPEKDIDVQEDALPVNFDQNIGPVATESKVTGMLKGLSMPSQGKKIAIGLALLFVVLVAGLVFLPKAVVTVYVEPRILEKDTQVLADPTIKVVDEAAKKIPAVLVDTQISGSGTSNATGTKKIGDSAKGVVVIINNTSEGINFPAGTTLTSPDGLKFKTDNSASVSATLADDTNKKTITVNVTAIDIGPEGNVPSGVNLAISKYSSSQAIAKTEGNLSGGTSKDVTVVTTDDQQKLLASVTADLKSKAKEQLQSKLNLTSADKKVLEETIAENILKKTFNKNVGEPASNFTLNLTVNYKGTAFSDVDLKTMVAKLVETTVPDGFILNLGEAETQADVSKIEKDGKVTFVARFKARLMPRIDTNQMKGKLIGKTPMQAAEFLKTYENVLGSEIKITPSLPSFLQRLPVLSKNITVNVGLK